MNDGRDVADSLKHFDNEDSPLYSYSPQPVSGGRSGASSTTAYSPPKIGGQVNVNEIDSPGKLEKLLDDDFFDDDLWAQHRNEDKAREFEARLALVRDRSAGVIPPAGYSSQEEDVGGGGAAVYSTP